MKDFVNCLLCGKPMRVYVSIWGYGGYIRILKCPHCGHIINKPLKTEIDPKDYYDSEYFLGGNPYHYTDERDEVIIRKIEDKRRIVNIIKIMGWNNKTYFPNMLDVGPGLGNLIKTAENFGFNAFGIDISKYVSEKGYKTALGNIEVYNPPHKLDIITMIEVFEHLENPIFALKNCYRILEENGLLVIQTANMGSWARRLEGKRCRYFLPGHLHYFNLKNLKRILKESGFKIEKVYYGKEDGFIPAFVRKLLVRRGRISGSDLSVFLKTLFFHILSKINWPFVINPTMTVYAKKCLN